MKERPILFSAPMVRAILEGRKTMTRRVATKIKAPKAWTMPNGIDSFWNVNPCWRETPGELCPYGQPGDRLWVRERINRIVGTENSYYAADGAITPGDSWLWKRRSLPSIHCPYGLSRITLEITNVRVERLQDISEEDAKNEGCLAFIKRDKGLHSYKDDFHHLWQSINGPCSWDANPWVWVVKFKRVEAVE